MKKVYIVLALYLFATHNANAIVYNGITTDTTKHHYKAWQYAKNHIGVGVGVEATYHKSNNSSSNLFINNNLPYDIEDFLNKSKPLNPYLDINVGLIKNLNFNLIFAKKKNGLHFLKFNYKYFNKNELTTFKNEKINSQTLTLNYTFYYKSKNEKKLNHFYILPEALFSYQYLKSSLNSYSQYINQIQNEKFNMSYTSMIGQLNIKFVWQKYLLKKRQLIEFGIWQSFAVANRFNYAITNLIHEEYNNQIKDRSQNISSKGITSFTLIGKPINGEENNRYQSLGIYFIYFFHNPLINR